VQLWNFAGVACAGGYVARGLADRVKLHQQSPGHNHTAQVDRTIFATFKRQLALTSYAGRGRVSFLAQPFFLYLSIASVDDILGVAQKAFTSFPVSVRHRCHWVSSFFFFLFSFLFLVSSHSPCR
jgi:hypothetical protein